jgi:hypothetical protein
MLSVPGYRCEGTYSFELWNEDGDAVRILLAGDVCVTRCVTGDLLLHHRRHGEGKRLPAAMAAGWCWVVPEDEED